MVRGLNALEAVTRLEFVRRDAAEPVAKLIKSAIANAEHNHKAEPAKLWISSISADNAGFLKRFRPRAMGRAAEIHKHLAHVSLELSDEPKTGRALVKETKTLAKRAKKVTK
jgi:large subunit ribosomal protein L22